MEPYVNYASGGYHYMAPEFPYAIPFFPAVPYFIYPDGRQWSPGYFPAPAPASPRYPEAAQETGVLDDSRDRKPLTFVLIHGAWADSSFWDGIAQAIRRMGHTVYTPEYPGHGSDPNKKVTHAMITEAIVEFITSHQLQNIILTGHSFGGSVVQKVAEQVPERIQRLVFWNAFVLLDGERVADAVPPPVRKLFQQLREESTEDTIALPFPLFREIFVNTADTELAKQMYQTLPAEPAAPLFEKLDLIRFYRLGLPASYVNLMEDTALPQGFEYSWHPHLSSRLGLFRFIQAHGDHMTTAKTQPDLIAQKLYEAARE